MQSGGGSPAPLGVTPVEGGVNVAVASAHASRIYFCHFDAHGKRELHRIALTQRDGHVHYGFIAGIKPGALYGLRADGPWNPHDGQRFDVHKLLVDPFAKMCIRDRWHGRRRLVGPQRRPLRPALQTTQGVTE